MFTLPYEHFHFSTFSLCVCRSVSQSLFLAGYATVYRFMSSSFSLFLSLYFGMFMYVCSVFLSVSVSVFLSLSVSPSLLRPVSLSRSFFPSLSLCLHVLVSLTLNLTITATLFSMGVMPLTAKELLRLLRSCSPRASELPHTVRSGSKLFRAFSAAKQ